MLSPKDFLLEAPSFVLGSVWLLGSRKKPQVKILWGLDFVLNPKQLDLEPTTSRNKQGKPALG